MYGATIQSINQRWLIKRRKEIADFYSVRLPQEDYDLLTQYISSSQNPELSTARFNAALAFKKVHQEMDLTTLLRDLDSIEIATYQKPLKSKWDFGQAVMDNALFAKNMIEESHLYAELYRTREAQLHRGNPAFYEPSVYKLEEQGILERLNIIREENQKLLARMPIPKNWIEEATKYGTQGIVQSFIPSVSLLAGFALSGVTFGVSGALGLAAAGAYTFEVSQGQAYGDLIERGFSHDIAGRTSLVLGTVNAGIELALDATIGAFAKMSGMGNLTSRIANKVTTALTNKLHYTGLLAKIASNLAKIPAAGASEGLEEVLQELSTLGGEYIASAFEEENVPLDLRTSQEIGRDILESVKGGVIGGLVLGTIGGGIHSTVDVIDAMMVKHLAQTETNQTDFNNATSGFFKNNKNGKKLQREVFERGQQEQVEFTEQDIINNIKNIRDSGKGSEPIVLDEEGNVKEVGTEYRNEDGKLNTYFTKVKGNSGLYIVVNDKNERYGKIKYTLNDTEGSITIDSFRMTEQRENIREEFFDDFAREFAGYNIEWNTQGEYENEVKDRLIAKNKKGTSAGLNYYDSYDNDAFTEKFIDKVKEVYKKGSILENAVIARLFKHQAELEGKGFEQWVNDTFGGIDSIFTTNPPEVNGNAISLTGKKGAVSFLAGSAQDAKAIIHLTEKSDFSTFAHELAHIAQRHLSEEDQKLSHELFKDEEDFANSYVKYYKDGIVNDKRAEGLFKKISQFLKNIADSFIDKIKLSPEKRQFFDKISQIAGEGTQNTQKTAQTTSENTQQSKDSTTTAKTPSEGAFANVKNRSEAVDIMYEEAGKAYRAAKEEAGNQTELQKKLKDDTDSVLFQTDDDFVEDAMSSITWEELQAKTEAIDPSEFAPIIAEELNDLQDDIIAKQAFYKNFWEIGQELKQSIARRTAEFKQKAMEASSWVDLRDDIESDLETWYFSRYFADKRLPLEGDPEAIDNLYESEWKAAQTTKKLQEIRQSSPEKADAMWIEEKFTGIENADTNVVQFLSSIYSFRDWFLEMQNSNFNIEARADLMTAPDEWKGLSQEQLEKIFEETGIVITHPTLKSAFERINYTRDGNSRRDTLINGNKDDTEATSYLRRIVTNIKNHTREYRRVWAHVIPEPEWAVADNDSILVKLKERNAKLNNPVDLENISPEDLIELSKTIRDEEIRQGIADGTITIDGIDHFVKSLDNELQAKNDEIKEAEYEYKEYLNEQIQEYNGILADHVSNMKKLKVKLENISDKERIEGTKRYIKRLDERIKANANDIRAIHGGGKFFDQDKKKYVHRKVEAIANINVKNAKSKIERQEEAISENRQLVREIYEKMGIKEVRIEKEEQARRRIRKSNERHDRDMKEQSTRYRGRISQIRKAKNTKIADIRTTKNAKIADIRKAKNEKYDKDMKEQSTRYRGRISQIRKAGKDKLATTTGRYRDKIYWLNLSHRIEKTKQRYKTQEERRKTGLYITELKRGEKARTIKLKDELTSKSRREKNLLKREINEANAKHREQMNELKIKMNEATTKDREQMNELKREMNEANAKHKEQMNELKKDIKEVDTKYRKQMNELKKDMNKKRNEDMKELRTAKNAEIADIRTTKNTKIAELIKDREEKLKNLRDENKAQKRQKKAALELKKSIKRLKNTILHPYKDIYQKIDTPQAKSIIGIQDLIKKNQEHFKEQVKQADKETKEEIDTEYEQINQQITDTKEQLKLVKQQSKEKGRSKTAEIEELMKGLLQIEKDSQSRGKKLIREKVEQLNQDKEKIKQEYFEIRDQLNKQIKTLTEEIDTIEENIADKIEQLQEIIRKDKESYKLRKAEIEKSLKSEGLSEQLKEKIKQESFEKQEQLNEQIKELRQERDTAIKKIKEAKKQLKEAKKQAKEEYRSKQREIEELWEIEIQAERYNQSERIQNIREQFEQLKQAKEKIKQDSIEEQKQLNKQIKMLTEERKKAAEKKKEQKKNRFANFTFIPLKVDPDVKETIKNVIGDELYSLVVNRPFRLWELTDLQNMAKKVKDIYKEGLDNKNLKDEARRLLNQQFIKRINSAVTSAGIVEGDSERTKRRKNKKLKQDLKLNDFSNPEAKPNRFLQSLLYNYNDADLARVARILDNQNQGVNYQLLYEMEDIAYNEKHNNIRERQQKMQERFKNAKFKLTKEGLPIELFAETGITFEHYYNQIEQLTIEKLLHMKAAAGNKHSRAHIAYGHFLSQQERSAIAEALRNNNKEEAEKIIKMGDERYDTALKTIEDFFNKEENKKFLTVIDFFRQDYDEQYPRMNQFSMDEWGMPVQQVKDYLPIMVLSTNGKASDYDIWRDLQVTNSPMPSYVSKGRTIERQDIPAQHQTPIKLGIYSTWLTASEQVEHFIAYSGYVRKLNAIYGKQTPASKALMENIQKRYGEGMIKFIENHIAETAHPYQYIERSGVENLLTAFRGRLAPAYIAKLSSVIMQAITSPPGFLIYVSPPEYVSATLQFFAHPFKMTKLIDDMSVHMYNRSASIMHQLAEEQKARSAGKKSVIGKVGHALDLMNSTTLKPLDIIDRAAVYPGWLAVYIQTVKQLSGNKKFTLDDRGQTPAEIHQEAINRADSITRLVQPQTRKTDIAPLFKNKNQLAKMFLQFQVALNTVWKTFRYDMPYHVAQKRTDRLFKTIIYYALANVLLGGLRHGYDDDDEAIDILKKWIWWGTSALTDSIPVVGGAATAAVGTALTGKDRFSYTTLSPSLPVFEQGVQTYRSLSKGIRDEDEISFAKAAEAFAELLGLATGFPVSQVKEWRRALDATGDDDTPFWLEILGRRDK
jgi:hypothetical protein